MGVVHVATDLRLKREVVLKIVHPHIAEDPELRRRFLKEAESMARLRHPNVIEIYDIGEVDECPYLVMPHLRATDLVKWTRARGGPPVPLDVAVGLVGQVAAGVMAMHAEGLVHGDIKPYNILVSEDFEAVVADLGLVRSTRGIERVQALGGTPGYIAPELIDEESVHPRYAHKADVYALGVTLYWLLVGQIPAHAREARTILARQVSGDVVVPSERRPELPTSFDVPLLRALHRDPAQRPDASEFREAIFEARDGIRRDVVRPFVVVIDDDPDMLALVQDVLMEQSHGEAEVVALRDSVAALSLIESRPPDLVITDLQMPGLNGVELTALIRGNPATRDVPVIVLTAVGGAEDWQLLRDLGASRFLVKPIDPAMLSAVVMPMLVGASPERRRLG